ncbi:MAG: hypothetical protein JJU12_07345 [Chlamydiales bacterium]|nr:hypothetical protein [Chlamydiales bacterium]
MYPVQSTSCFNFYNLEGNPSKVVPVVMTAIGALGALLVGLGLAGHLPFYASVIGFADLAAVCIAASLMPRRQPQAHREEISLPPVKVEEIYYDVLRMSILPLLSADGLGRVAQVCTRLRDLAYDDFLWKSHWINEQGTDILPEGFESYREAFQDSRTNQTRYARGLPIPIPLSNSASLFYASGDLLCSGHKSNCGFMNLVFWDLAKRKEIRQHKGMQFSPTAIAGWKNHVFLASLCGEIQSLNLQNGTSDFFFNSNEVSTSMFCENGILICSNPGGIRAYRADSGIFLYRYLIGWDVVGVKMCGDLLAVGEKNGRISLLNLTDGSLVKTLDLKKGLSAFCIREDKIVIAGYENGSIELLDPEAKQPLKELSGEGSVSHMQCVGKLLLSKHDKMLYVWNLNTGIQLRKLTFNSTLQFNASHMVFLSGNTINMIDFSTK